MPTIVEDASSAVSYSGGWSVVTGSSSDYSGGAVHSTSSSGSTATIRFSGEISALSSFRISIRSLCAPHSTRYFNYSIWRQSGVADPRVPSLRQLHFRWQRVFLGSYGPWCIILQRSILGLWATFQWSPYPRDQEYRLKPGLHSRLL